MAAGGLEELAEALPTVEDRAAPDVVPTSAVSDARAHAGQLEVPRVDVVIAEQQERHGVDPDGVVATLHRHHGPDTEAGTEEWQAANFRSHWEQCADRFAYVAGYTFWVLKDYKQRLGYNEELNGISTMGLVGFDSTTRRLVYDAFADAELPV